MTARRAFVVVIDGAGIGALPDADHYGDAGANTLAHVAQAEGGLVLPTFEHLGLGAIVSLAGLRSEPGAATYGRLAAQGPGKDSTAGHWELMGVVTPVAMPTYPEGFPAHVIDVIATASGKVPLGNVPADGLQVIDDFGAEHLATGRLIVYTSQDSVLQIAAHVDVLAEDELCDLCERVRTHFVGEDAIGRVIARPFTGRPTKFVRTGGRRDFAVTPPTRSYLEAVQSVGGVVHGVGKVVDLFAGVGFDVSHRAADNVTALAHTTRLIEELRGGLVVTNLIETDQVHGHRKDTAGFHAALREIDAAVGHWLPRLRPSDLLIITSDHGVDPRAAHSDHTREYVPLLAYVAGRPACRHDGAMADVGATVGAWLGAADESLPGRDLLAVG